MFLQYLISHVHGGCNAETNISSKMGYQYFTFGKPDVLRKLNHVSNQTQKVVEIIFLVCTPEISADQRNEIPSLRFCYC